MRTAIKPLTLALLAGLLSLGSNIITNVASEWISAQMNWLLVTVIALLFGGIMYFYVRSKQTIEVSIALDALRTAQEEERCAQRGLIVFLSLYRALDGPAKTLTAAQIDQAVKNLDYVALDLDNTRNTTLGHPIRAIKAHQKKLERCWLISTQARTPGKRQSFDYAPVIEKYIKDQINPNIAVHWKEYILTLDIEEKVCRDAYRLVQQIYSEANRLGIKKNEMITDVTGGVRGIMLGAVLACLDKDEDVEYIGADYDEAGNPTGPSFPVIVEYRAEPSE